MGRVPLLGLGPLWAVCATGVMVIHLGFCVPYGPLCPYWGLGALWAVCPIGVWVPYGPLCPHWVWVPYGPCAPLG